MMLDPSIIERLLEEERERESNYIQLEIPERYETEIWDSQDSGKTLPKERRGVWIWTP